MAKIQIKAGNEYLAKISKLSALAQDRVCGRSIYAGSAVVADAVREEIQALPTAEHEGKPWFGTAEHPARGPSPAQKKGLLDSLGVTPMADDGKGFLNVKIGFDGYNSEKNKLWPKGQPNQMVARSVERGTSFMTPNPFMKTAVAKARKRAKAAMEKTAEREVEKIMKG